MAEQISWKWEYGIRYPGVGVKVPPRFEDLRYQAEQYNQSAVLVGSPNRCEIVKRKVWTTVTTRTDGWEVTR